MTRNHQDDKLGLAHTRHTAASLYNVLGIAVAALACLNFISAIIHFPMTDILRQMLATYQAIVHGGIDWLTYLLQFRLPGPLKDFLFIYGVIGGGFMRARMIDEGCKGGADRPKTLAVLARVLLWPHRTMGLIRISGEPGVSTDRRLVAIYQNAPSWLRRAMDFLLWPRVARQFWKNPRVYKNEYLGTYPSFSANYRPGSHKVFLYDRRHRFYLQVGAVFGVVVFVIVVNGFLTLPAR